MAKTPDPTADEKLVEECHDEFKRCEDRESDARTKWRADLRFANGDPDNGYQWDDAMRLRREADQRPCLTINKVKQHNRQITNDARQNKPSVRVYPVDDGADRKTADVFNGIIRHIEANSNADTAYDTAGEFAVDAGLGYWRVTTDYAADDTFDQEIYIKACPNPLNVYLGRHVEADGSDARYGFVFDDLPKKDFERKYPNAEAVGWPDDAGSSWLTKDMIRVCEFFKIVEEEDTLCAGANGQSFKLSEVTDKDMLKAIKADTSIKKRKVSNRKCKWYLIAGDQIIDRKDWAGKYIPIVRVVGEEVEIDGQVDRKGHTRAMKDAQRMYNFWTSAAVEFVALQGKQPYIAAAEAIADYEDEWANLNSSNKSYIPYNSVDEAGNPIPRPERQQPPVMAPAYMTGMQVASEEMKMASGQYDASMGAKSNETSGRAIMARQREGDNATFHFIDNVARAIRYTGKILVDLIPKIYDIPRVVRILGEDGKEDKAHIDPRIDKAVIEQKDENGAIREIYNPSVGRYDVVVTVGPSYGTKRQEAFNALTEMASRNPAMMNIAGDLVMKSADFPMAEQLAERFEKALPPELRDADEAQAEVPPQVKAQMQQMEQALQNASQMVDELEASAKDSGIEKGKLEVERIKANTSAYDAITKRLAMLGPLLAPGEVAALAAETKREAMEQPDPGQPPSESMGVPESPPDPMQAEQTQPADAGFFMPTEGQQ
jgi:hypothetical protein